MADLFLDSSALVKRYASETGSAWVRGLFRPELRHTIYLSRITPVEAVAGLARQNRTGFLSADDFEKAVQHIDRAIRKKFTFADITQDIVGSGILLVKKHGLRGYDAVQLATALSISSTVSGNGFPPLVFISADYHLNKAASAEGLAVDNPNDHP